MATLSGACESNGYIQLLSRASHEDGNFSGPATLVALREADSPTTFCSESLAIADAKLRPDRSLSHFCSTRRVAVIASVNVANSLPNNSHPS
jgi:hypothetical protein